MVSANFSNTQKISSKLTQTSESRQVCNQTAEVCTDIPDLAVFMFTMSASPFITLNQQKTLVVDFNIQDRWHWKIPLRTKNLLSSSKISLSKQECVIFKGTVSNEESSTQLYSLADIVLVQTSAVLSGRKSCFISAALNVWSGTCVILYITCVDVHFLQF